MEKPNGKSLAVLREIHKARIKDIEENYQGKHEEVEELAEEELKSNPEFVGLEKERKEIEKLLEKVKEKQKGIEKEIKRRRNLPESRWEYKGQLLEEEQQRYERELNSLLNTQGRGE